MVAESNRLVQRVFLTTPEPICSNILCLKPCEHYSYERNRAE